MERRGQAKGVLGEGHRGQSPHEESEGSVIGEQ